MTTMTQTKVNVIGGVDTHGEVHLAAAVDEIGRVLGTASFATTAALEPSAARLATRAR